MKEFELKRNKLLKVIWKPLATRFNGPINCKRLYIGTFFLKYITDTWIDAKESYILEYGVKKTLLMN